MQAKGADERELISLAATVPFDDRSNHSAKLEDLSRDLMVEFLRQVKSDLAKPARTMSLPKLARQMNLSGGPAESPMPRNVGLLFSIRSRTHSFRKPRSMLFGFRRAQQATASRKRFFAVRWDAWSAKHWITSGGIISMKR